VGPLPAIALIAPAGGSEAIAALAALRSALAYFVQTQQRPERDPPETGQWEGEGGAPGQSPPPEVDARVALGRERRAWAAHGISHDEVADAVRTYTRVLRHAGAPLAPSLVAVDAAVREHAAGRLPAETYGAVQRDAARSCLEAYYGP
jgi:hypothetical protein